VAGEERVRPRPMQPRQTVELSASESWRLLSGVSVGRIVFTQRAMPAVRPVNHLVEQEDIIVRSHLGAAIVAHARTVEQGTVVAYEADDIDLVRHTGWSVIATGMAWLVSDPAAVGRYEQMLEPWVQREMDHVIAIRPQIITGLRLTGWSQ
jgi:Pyridoxamine 5'-phosphate oxidase